MALPRVEPWGFVGMAGLAGVLFLDAASASFAPWWVALGLLLSWAVLFVLGCRWFMPHPRRVLWTAVGGVVLWFAVAVGGGVLAG
ncbi:MAG: hypothetical protein QM638_12410 [Nocardioides sp.]|uniref:hypothetical protein n=1 Tax=Nocardioides sp. TaxID=35761 RepID=UPI0039E405A0